MQISTIEATLVDRRPMSRHLWGAKEELEQQLKGAAKIGRVQPGRGRHGDMEVRRGESN